MTHNQKSKFRDAFTNAWIGFSCNHSDNKNVIVIIKITILCVTLDINNVTKLNKTITCLDNMYVRRLVGECSQFLQIFSYFFFLLLKYNSRVIVKNIPLHYLNETAGETWDKETISGPVRLVRIIRITSGFTDRMQSLVDHHRHHRWLITKLRQ